MALSQRTILYFGNTWDAENRTSSHHLAHCLAREHQVYYLECPGIRAPTASRRDLRRIVQKLWQSLSGPRQVAAGLKVQTLLQIPLHRFAAVRWLNAWLVWWSVRALMWRHGIRHPVAWFVVPHVASLAGRLGESLSVYYCIDDYASMPGIDPESIRAMDARLTREASLVFVASETLLAAKAAINPHTYHSPHGVDVEHFGQACDGRLETPEDIRELRPPIIGFFGLVERWIDLELVGYLARQRPQWTFLMIGRVAVPEKELPRLSNVHFIGQRPYKTLPHYGRHFDAAIIPYKLAYQVPHANPLKLREYLAMGKPVVSVATPAIEEFADIVGIARNREEFLAKLDTTLQQPDTPEAVLRRIGRVASSSWQARAQCVLEHVVRQHGRALSCDGL